MISGGDSLMDSFTSVLQPLPDYPCLTKPGRAPGGLAKTRTVRNIV